MGYGPWTYKTSEFFNLLNSHFEIEPLLSVKGGVVAHKDSKSKPVHLLGIRSGAFFGRLLRLRHILA